MKIEFNTLYWNNTDERMVHAQKSVMDHFNIPINYYNEDVPHGSWMDRVCWNSNSDIIGFFDLDCVPINYHKIIECVKYVQKSKTFLGVAQTSNHISPKSHIYAAPAFFLVHKECFNMMRSSFSETKRGDVAEEFSYVAETAGVKYRCLYPTTFEGEPTGGVWPLSNFGYYGIGTTFANTVYHLYQARFSSNIELFIKRCQEIINGTFDNSFHIDSKILLYNGNITA